MDLYLEGELGGMERREVEAHLAACPSCRRLLEDRRLLGQAFSSLPPIEVPQDFAGSVLARLPVESQSSSRRFIALMTGTAVLLAGLLGCFLLTGESLFGILAAAGRTVADAFILAVPFGAKLFEVVRVCFKLGGDLGTAVLKALGFLSSLLRPEAIGLALILGLALSLLVVFGVKKIVSLGEKS
jgi:predicted anti-sigma-YlaC factor YlaD